MVLCDKSAFIFLSQPCCGLIMWCRSVPPHVSDANTLPGLTGMERSMFFIPIKGAWLLVCMQLWFFYIHYINTLRPRQNGRHFPDDIFKCIFLNENVSIPIKISLKIVPKSPINTIPAYVQIMAWRRPGDKPLSEPMMVNLLMHICITRPT